MASIPTESAKELIASLDSFNTEGKLDFDTWWKREAREKATDFSPSSEYMIRELCRTAWENGADKAKAK